MNRVLRTASYAAAAALALLLGAWLASSRHGGPVAPRIATVYSTPRPFPTLELSDHTGQAFGPEQLTGRWSWVFFGFTHCPDICPTTLQILKRAQAALPVGEPLPQVILVSVDPERDSADVLARYVAHFDPEFRGVTGDVDSIARLTEALFVSYAKIPLPDGGYTVDHSAAIFFVNPNGQIVAVSTPPHGARNLAHDLLALRKP